MAGESIQPCAKVRRQEIDKSDDGMRISMFVGDRLQPARLATPIDGIPAGFDVNGLDDVLGLDVGDANQVRGNGPATARYNL